MFGLDLATARLEVLKGRKIFLIEGVFWEPRSYRRLRGRLSFYQYLGLTPQAESHYPFGISPTVPHKAGRAVVPRLREKADPILDCSHASPRPATPPRSPTHKPTIDHQIDASTKRSSSAQQKNRGSNQFINGCHAPQWRICLELFALFRDLGAGIHRS